MGMGPHTTTSRRDASGVGVARSLTDGQRRVNRNAYLKTDQRVDAATARNGDRAREFRAQPYRARRTGR
jgi:hypothetical protein